MPSQVNGSIPVSGQALNASPIQTNFLHTKTEIEALQTGKQDQLVSGTHIKTVNGHTLLGSGDVTIAPGGTGTVTSISAGTGLGGGTITGAGTLSLTTPVALNHGGTGVAAVSGHAALDHLSGASGATTGSLQRAAGGTWSVAAAGGGGIPEPTVAGSHLRTNAGAWVAGLALTGGTVTGACTFSGAHTISGALNCTSATNAVFTHPPRSNADATNNNDCVRLSQLNSRLKALEDRIEDLENAGPGPAPWEMTRALSGSIAVITKAATKTGLGPLTGWTNHSAAVAADMNDDLYNAATPAAQKVRLFATFHLQPEVEVPFDNFSNPTVTGNAIRQWGYDSGDNHVYLDGGQNSSSQPIQLRLARS